MNPIISEKMMPVRFDAGLERLLGLGAGHGAVCPDPNGTGPALQLALNRPVGAGLAVQLTVRSRAGIPVAALVILGR